MNNTLVIIPTYKEREKYHVDDGCRLGDYPDIHLLVIVPIILSGTADLVEKKWSSIQEGCSWKSVKERTD
jgi:hypothetical protein